MPAHFTLSPRWRKVLRDMWLNKARTILVVLAIAIGIFGVGTVVDSYAILVREMDKNYMQTNPASATLWTDPLDESFVQAVRSQPGIGEAEARRMIVGRIQIGPDEWRDIWLFVIDDFNNVRLDTFQPEQGQYPPALGEILLERAALSMAEAKIGEVVTVRIPGNSSQGLKLVGTVHAPGLAPAWMEGFAYGFISRETLADLGGTPYLDQLKIQVAENQLDKTYIRDRVNQLKKWMEQNGLKVYQVKIPEPGKHPHVRQMSTFLFLLEAFGLLALVLSGMLVANMISALLAQQIRQIGVMKAVGANTRQVTGLYFGVVLFLGLVGLAIGMPLALAAGRGYAAFAANMLNFQIFSDQIPLPFLTLQAVVGLLVPLLVAVYPIYRGSRITVREAINDYGITNGGEQKLDPERETIFRKVQLALFSRPFLLSLRNTFRHRGRLILTLGTLAVGGATFIVAMNVAASMNNTVAVKFDAERYDIQVRFNRPYPADKIESVVSSVPGVKRVESWGGASVVRIYPDGTTGNNFNLVAPPSNTDLMAGLPLTAGRWLQPGDRNILVINQQLLADEPGIRVGDELKLKIGEQVTTWKVIGIAAEIMALPTVYTNNEYFTELTGQTGYAQNIVIVTEQRDTASVAAVVRSLEHTLGADGFDVGAMSKLADTRQAVEAHLKILATFLVMMSVLVLFVGGLGLASTMSINILERRREIGVLRAIGASTQEVLQIIVAEGTIIGALSWVLAVVLSWPISAYVSYNFGMIFFEAPLKFVFSPTGLLVWLGIVIVFAAAASFYPAWNASHLTVREVLAYE